MPHKINILYSWQEPHTFEVWFLNQNNTRIGECSFTSTHKFTQLWSILRRYKLVNSGFGITGCQFVFELR